ncbi:hypothetical protein ML462_11045 [Gramella lutea]|uniref:Uncharacterized protein n=1 Tax=Christiangramia lutea TaxID=1607951 RepID=A0A9X2AAZ4_9FLAO|nr:hypothetical protein [Christiangramia lutea]MCH4823706.1 hypothetical protein [Christiangramia lutea]
MGKKISNVDAKKLFDGWTGKNGPGKSVSRAGFVDSYESWFSAEELKNFCQEVIDAIGEENNPGIRIYFGNYGKNSRNKKNQSTVFLAPTKGGNKDDFEASVPENDYSLESYNSGSNRVPPIDYDPGS